MVSIRLPWILATSILLLSCDNVVGPEQRADSRILEDKISDESYRAWRFDLPKGGRNFQLEGSFLVTRGGSRDINAYVVDETGHINFRMRNNFQALYGRKRVTAGQFELSLRRDEGPYYFILSNRFSMFTDKWVRGSVTLTYDR